MRQGFGKGSRGWSSFWSLAQSGGLSIDDPNIAMLYSTRSMTYRALFMGRWDLGVGGQGEHLPGSLGFVSFYGTPLSHSPGCSSNKMFRFTDWDYFLLLLRQNQMFILIVAAACILPRLVGVRREMSLIMLTVIGGVSLFGLRVYCWLGPLSPSSCVLYEDNVISEQPYQDDLMTRRITQKAVHFLKFRRSETFLLMVSYLQPKYPAFASEQFKNKSGISPYYDAVLEIDWSIGKILQTLENEGISDNTMIIFLSDNGPQLTDMFTGKPIHPSMRGQNILHHRNRKIILKGEKGSCYEGGIRIPAIIKWPGKIKHRSETNVVTSVLDIFPTVMEAINQKNKYKFNTFDGKSLMTLFDNPKQKSDTIHDHLFHISNLMIPEADWAVTAGDMKVHFVDCTPANDCKSSKSSLIYNISADPGETTPLSVKEHAGLLYNLQLDMARTNLMFNGQPRQSKFDEIPYPWNFPCATYNFLFCRKEIDHKENFNLVLP